MRVLISAPYVGGAGGIERAVWSIACALAEDDVEVVAGQVLDGLFAELPPGTSLSTPRDWRWRGARTTSPLRARLLRRIVNPVRKMLIGDHDVLISYPYAVDLSDSCRAQVRLAVPAGEKISLPRPSYDLVALESPNNAEFAPHDGMTTILPPPYVPVASESKPPATALPPRFFLTVFNPYGPVKGMDDLAWAADTAPHPIVWCHSSRTLAFQIEEPLAQHPNIVHVDDATPEELRYLYEECDAYLMFSKSEGFGWAALDGLAHSPLVVARATGIFSFPECPRDGVLLLGDDWRVDWSDVGNSPRSAQRDLAWLSAPHFRERLQRIIARHS